MMKRIYLLLFSVNVLIMLLFASCQSDITTDDIVATATVMIGETEVTSKPTPVTSITSTIAMKVGPYLLSTPTKTIVTSTPMPTQTALPTHTPFPVHTATPIPWSTLLPDEATEQVLSLLADNKNSDCLLPCWWGAIPGQTQWHDLHPYLESFALEMHSLPEESVFVAMFPVPEGINYRKKLNIVYRLDASGIITNISVAAINIDGYDPQAMMTLYGVPDEVWLRTLSDDLPGDILPFVLVVVYQEQGISFYYYVDAFREGEMVTACFEPDTVEVERLDLFPASPKIHLWEAGSPRPINKIAPGRVYPLEEKTELTPQTFYERFTNSNERRCISTPSELWD